MNTYLVLCVLSSYCSNSLLNQQGKMDPNKKLFAKNKEYTNIEPVTNSDDSLIE